MKIRYQLFLAVLGSLALSACSGMKLSNTYKSDSFETIHEKKILVISRTPLENVRTEYEKEIAKRLKAKGINAVASHLAFPKLKRIDNKTAERISEVVAMFKEDDFDIILMTSLKDVQEQEIQRREGGYNSLTQYYGNQYITLRGYYDDVNAPPKLPPREQEALTSVEKSMTFILEAVSYNLDLDEEKRLLSVITAEVINPDSGKSVRKAFAKIVADELQ